MSMIIERTPIRAAVDRVLVHEPSSGWAHHPHPHHPAAAEDEVVMVVDATPDRERFLAQAQFQLRQLEEEEFLIKERLRLAQQQQQQQQGLGLETSAAIVMDGGAGGGMVVEAPFAKLLDELVYPEPSAEWQLEVAALQDRVADIQRQEADLAELEAQRNDKYNREWNRLTDHLQESGSALHANQLEEVKSMVERHSKLRVEELEEMVRIANERCNTLNRLFEIKLNQKPGLHGAAEPTPRPWPPPAPANPTHPHTNNGSGETRRLHLRVKQLEAQVHQLQSENEALRTDLADTAGSRQREEELRRICAEQARELEARMHPPSGGGVEDDFSHVGVQVTNAVVPGGLRAESQSGVRVTRTVAPAAEAGVRVGDVITWVTTSTRVTDVHDFANGVGKARLGDSVTLLVRRGTQEKRIDLEVGRRKSF